jgi:hypothetical protein
MDGSILEEQTLAQGSENTWDLSEYEQVEFRFGNTRSVVLVVNGERMDLSELPNLDKPQNVLIQFKPLVGE